jgi:hypothetical protein
MSTANRPPGLTDLPLWRLLVALDDAERKLGADSPTARTLADEIQRRLKTERNERSQGKRKGATNG